MKKCPCSLKDIIAVVIALASLAGVAFMFTSESLIVPNQLPYAEMLPGLKQYALALGGVFFAVSISLILIGRENELSTSADKPDKR